MKAEFDNPCVLLTSHSCLCRSRWWLGLLGPLCGGYSILCWCRHPSRRPGSVWWPRRIHCKNQGLFLMQLKSVDVFILIIVHPRAFRDSWNAIYLFFACGPSVVQLFELGPDGGDHETDGDLLAETDVLAYDCAARWNWSFPHMDTSTHVW